ncbi:hypothetical protein HMF8227_02225 [Saliniradius amylolyticus]|uniref:L-ornithine N(alpha)-acyltransferase n=1 Tax=Saliniradius amylolyticus TaxID=2183582 RepID=A0A2S2E4U0_9ALTE|nr:lysophospholipid acyltransferase family protein [Saliniradius amylolyticus]AWL12678.1 hypothetical protein HMF8227_02225 [Saliniradius amylolyticus]
MFTVNDVLQKHYPQLNNRPWLFKSLSFVLRHLLHEQECQDFAKEYPYLQGLEFVEQVLEYFNFSYSCRASERERIPTQGRVVIIANHPIGSLDGLALLKMISEVRSDIKIIANEMLMAIEPLHEMLLPVNNMHGGTAKDHLARIQHHLRSEGVVIIFPSGEVSRLRPQGVRDTRWRSGFLRIAASAKAPIVPIFIDGKNSPLFYGASMLYKPLATMLLVTEMFKHRKQHLPMRVGEMIPYEAYNQPGLSVPQKVKLMKKHLYRIGHGKASIFATQKAIALPEDRQHLQKAIHKECQLLGHTADGKDIYLYNYSGSSPIMREIGRLREVAFRSVGEGSNRRRDIEHYDSYYHHLVLWDKGELEIVGAYRFGNAARLAETGHPCGLYSASLFHFGERMTPYLDQGLELGRSFVQPKYWGKRSLDYLWYGIGAFLKQNPNYRYLFGPVSISGAFPAGAKDLLVQFYQLYFGGDNDVAVSNQPYSLPEELKDAFSGEDYKEDFKKLKHLLANMGTSVPTLYKQYTELCEPGGVQFLSFGVDPDFNDCVDGLVLVDITRLKEKKRKRYIA